MQRLHIKCLSLSVFAISFFLISCKTIRQPENVPQPLNYSDDDTPVGNRLIVLVILIIVGIILMIYNSLS